MSRYRAPGFALYAVLILAALFILTPNSLAQSPAATTQAPGAARAYDATKETVLSGTITRAGGRPKAGLPLGMYLELSTAQGEVNVHLGRYFGRVAAQNGLTAGASIKVTGVSMQFAGGEVFIARVITVGNQTLTIRNQNGMPVRPSQAGTNRGLQTTGGL